MASVEFKFENGDRVIDKITGFKGIVIGMTCWFTGCNTVGILPEELKDGKPFDVQWFDETRIISLCNKAFKIENTVDPGGPLLSIPQQTNRQ